MSDNHVPSDEATLLQMVRDRVVGRFQPIRLILFGSRARGDARPGSDIDLLVVLPEGVDKRRAAVEIRGSLSDLPVAKDVIVTTPGEIIRRGDMIGSILRPALLEGKTIYERN